MKKLPGRIINEALPSIFKKTATTTYPQTPLQIAKNYRGKLQFNSDLCIGCTLCMRDCPAHAIVIESVGAKEDKKFKAVLNIDHCIFCGQCVDSCRKGALSMGNHIELAAFDRKSLKVDL